ncbi:hypothetical protein A3L12_06660 [Thermococcus sp. P6]|uniref:hypothetical protein n=1 Tax=Thermococcus sp. P6 TaxID=122420 RepID=UPI000B59C354|nr:hypothetical protein [Thermococcus sp. P6]ASJ11004.1 hypothetical protein A3L12_06660 [Thermococcus sp. P6]
MEQTKNTIRYAEVTSFQFSWSLIGTQNPDFWFSPITELSILLESYWNVVGAGAVGEVLSILSILLESYWNGDRDVRIRKEKENFQFSWSLIGTQEAKEVMQQFDNFQFSWSLIGTGEHWVLKSSNAKFLSILLESYWNVP